MFTYYYIHTHTQRHTAEKNKLKSPAPLRSKKDPQKATHSTGGDGDGEKPHRSPAPPQAGDRRQQTLHCTLHHEVTRRLDGLLCPAFFSLLSASFLLCANAIQCQCTRLDETQTREHSGNDDVRR